MAEIIEFVRPDRNECNIFVTNIPTDMEELELQNILHEKFSQFGLIYEVQVKSQRSKINDDERTCFAFVKFFSTEAASRAKTGLVGRLMLKGQMLKTQFAKRKTLETTKPLYMTRCYELANHYLSFNGWSIDLKKLDLVASLSSEPGKPTEAAAEARESSSDTTGRVTYVAAVRLSLMASRLYADGRGTSTQTWTTADPCSHSIAICRCKKQAYQHAVEAAFGKVLLVVTDSGKVHVEVNTTLEEELQEYMDMEPVVKVNDLDESPDESSDEQDTDLINALADLANENDDSQCQIKEESKLNNQ